MDLLKAIDKVAEILNTSDIKEIKIKDGSTGIYMTKNMPAASVVTTAAPTQVAAPAPAVTTPATSTAKPVATEAAVNGEEFKSPMVGTFYAAASPEAAPYVKEGQEVKQGDVLCIVEAMKIMNKIEAEKSGKIVKVLAKDGEPVQFDQPLFIIE